MIDHYPANVVRVASGPAQIAVHHLGGIEALPPLLVSHATGFHAHAYRAVARHLERHFQVFGLDHRGHGATASPDGAVIDWRDCALDTAAVGRHLAPTGGLVGVGHSMGGATLLLAARRDPDLFERLVLFEPIAFPPDQAHTSPSPASEDNPMVAAARRRRRRFDSYDAAFQNYASKPPLGQFEPSVLRDYVDFGFAPTVDGIELRCTPEMEAATFAAASESGLWDELPNIHVPTVIIGSGDGGVPATAAPLIARLMPNATFVPLAEQNHFGPFVLPESFADLV